MNNLRMSVRFASLAILVALAAACATTPAPISPQQPPAAAKPTEVVKPSLGPVRFNALWSDETKTLDPARGADNPSRNFYKQVYESLVDHKPGSVSREDLEGVLASKWEVSKDNTVFTFQLRPNVKFHDGTVLDAEDVKVSIERLKKIGLGFSWTLNDMKEVRIVDPMKVEIVLTKPSAVFLDLVPLMFIISADAIKKNEKSGDLAQAWANEQEAGSGPYSLESWVRRQELTLTKFNEYWGGWSGKHLDKIVYRLVPEAASQTLAVRKGDAHWGDIITDEDSDIMAKDPKFQVIWRESLYNMWFLMNTKKKPLDDLRVREALRYALDYKTMVNNIMLGHGKIPRGFLPTGFKEHDPSIPEEKQDMPKAKQLLEQAGLSKGFSLEMVYLGPYEWERKGCELYQSNLRELNINLSCKGSPFPTMTELASKEELRPDLMYITTIPTSGSPDSILFPKFHSKSTHWIRYGYSNPEVDKLLDAAVSEFDDVKRTELYRKVQQIVNQDSPGLNTVIRDYQKVFTANVRGYVFLPLEPAVVDMYLISFADQ